MKNNYSRIETALDNLPRNPIDAFNASREVRMTFIAAILKLAPTDLAYARMLHSIAGSFNSHAEPPVYNDPRILEAFWQAEHPPAPPLVLGKIWQVERQNRAEGIGWLTVGLPSKTYDEAWDHLVQLRRDAGGQYTYRITVVLEA